MSERPAAGIQHLEATEVLAALRTTAAGLDSNEAARRLAEYGPNGVAALPQRPWWRQLAAQFTHFFALVLWLAVALAFVAERAEPGQGMALLGWAILGVILVNGLFSFAQEHRAAHSLAALQRLLPNEVATLRDGEVTVLAAESLVPGDVILLEAGATVPADCRLLEAFGVRVNTATVTGESLPKARSAAAVDEDNLLLAANLLLAGTTVVAGEARAAVYATGSRSEFGRIAHLTQATAKVASPLQIEIARLSRWIALLATALGVVFFLLGQQLGLSFWVSFVFAIGIIVANVPEGLLPTVTLALAMGAQRMARRNALIRHLPSVETLGATTVICTDKTGTLTLNRLQVRRAYAEGRLAEAGGNSAPGSEVLRRMAQAAAHCHSLKRASANGNGNGNGHWLGDPLEIALLEWARGIAPGMPELGKDDELPFDSDRRRMSTLHAADTGSVLYTKGALEAVLPLCHDMLDASGAVPCAGAALQQLLAAEEALALDGLRVIALAERRVAPTREAAALECELTLLGLLALEDPLRPEVPGAIACCRAAGIRVLMVTGDHPRTALAVARRAGLVTGTATRVLDGTHLAHMSAAQLQLALEEPELVFARITADQKRRIVAALKDKGEVVAVTGDGVNDAPALREAHIGVAMGIAGTDVAKEAADMVLLDDNFASIVAAIEEGRAVFDNIRKFLTYILSSNVPELVPYLAYVLLRIPLPLTIIQILVVDLGTDMLPALALGAEKPDEDVMQRPPRRRDERLVDRRLLLRAYLWLGAFEAAAAMAAFFAVLGGAGWNYGESLATSDPLYLRATTACLGAIVLMQVVNVWMCRSDHLSLLRGLRGNRLILLGIGCELLAIALLVYTPWGNAVFGTAPLQPAEWLLALPFAALLLLAEELRKLLVRRSRRRHAAKPAAA